MSDYEWCLNKATIVRKKSKITVALEKYTGFLGKGKTDAILAELR